MLRRELEELSALLAGSAPGLYREPSKRVQLGGWDVMAMTSWRLAWVAERSVFHALGRHGRIASTFGDLLRTRGWEVKLRSVRRVEAFASVDLFTHGVVMRLADGSIVPVAHKTEWVARIDPTHDGLNVLADMGWAVDLARALARTVLVHDPRSKRMIGSRDGSWCDQLEGAPMTSLDTPTSVDDLIHSIDAGLAPDYLFFWGHTSKGRGLGKECLSQWYPASFIVDGNTFATAEHYMMWSKAMLFADGAAAERILAAAEPGAAKQLGRGVRGFDEDEWEANRFRIVVDGSIAKFSQNEELRAFLLGTKQRILVEASPRDTIWGIGMGETNEHARRPSQWRGLNLLGFALMVARARLRSGVGAV